MPLWYSNILVKILCHQSFLLHCLSLTCWKLLPFLESIFFSYDFKNRVFDYFSQFKCCVKRVSNYFCCFNGITVNLTKESNHGNMWKWTKSRLCTLLVQSYHQPCWNAPSGPKLDLLCVQQSGAALFFENYVKLYFDAKHLEKGLNRVW